MNNITTLTGLFKSNNALQIYRLSALLCLFILFNHAYLLISHLGGHGFRQNILFFSVLQRLGWMGSSVLTLSAVIGFYYGRFFIAWSELENSLALRRFITFLCIVLGGGFAIQAYNFYFSQGYYIDRFLLLMLIVLVYWRPVFVFALLFILLPLIWQWNVPLGGYLWGTLQHVL